jgi:hypothetical protein
VAPPDGFDYPGGWFGTHWGAAICDEAAHRITPIGVPCEVCKAPIERFDNGLLFPQEPVPGGYVLSAIHIGCVVRRVAR